MRALLLFTIICSLTTLTSCSRDNYKAATAAPAPENDKKPGGGEGAGPEGVPKPPNPEPRVVGNRGEVSGEVEKLILGYLEETPEGEVEHMAAIIIGEVFSEEGRAREKVFRIQNFIQNLDGSGAYDAVKKQRVKTLESGLHEVVNNKAWEEMAWDIAKITGAALAIAVVGGNSTQISKATENFGKFTKNFFSKAYQGAKTYPQAMVRKDTYKQAGTRIRQIFTSKTFRSDYPPLKAKETLMRNLQSLGLTSPELTALRGKMVEVSKAELKGEVFRKTPIRSLSVAGKSFNVVGNNGDNFGYLVFKQGKWTKAGYKTNYFKAANLTKEEASTLKKLYENADEKQFVKLITETGEVVGTRLRVKNLASGAYNSVVALKASALAGAKSLGNQATTSKSLRIFLFAEATIIGGYAFGRWSHEYSPLREVDVDLENHLREAIKTQQVAALKPENEK